MRLSFNIVELQRVTCRKSPILTYPPAFGASIGDDPVWVLPRCLVSENSTLCYLCDPKFSRFRRIPTCDIQTDANTAYTALAW